MLLKWSNCGCLAALFASVALISTATAQVPVQYRQVPPAGGPVYRVAERTDVPATNSNAGVSQMRPGDPNEHPLMPALRWAREGYPAIEKIQDYTATLIKRERIDNTLGEDQYIALKVRHKPFSVYLNFLAPTSLKGQECMFIEGANNGKMWAHGTGMKAVFGTVSLDPNGRTAMTDQRYPLTQIGVLNLTRRLIEVATEDVKYGECEVKYYKGAKINDRVCTCTEVLHPVPRKNFLFHRARIFVDDALNIPIRYEAYDWPKTEGGPPELIEAYTYLNLKLNVGLTDADFDIHNPAYRFDKHR
jgi:hypothetical protein